jgi:hypothetical protein
MNGKRTIPGLVFALLFLSAFSRPPAPRRDSDAKMILQYLTVVKTDGSAEFQFIFKYSAEQLKEILDAGQISEHEICEKTFSQTGDAAFSVTQERHGGEIWCTTVTKLPTLSDLSDNLRDEFDSLTVRRLEFRNGNFYLDLSWSEFPCTTPDPSRFTCEWTVQAPGMIGKNNATRVEGNSLTWDMSASDTPHNFQAQSTDLHPWIVLLVLICGCCTVLLLTGAGAAVFLILRKRKKPSDAQAHAGDPRPAPPPSPAATVRL